MSASFSAAVATETMPMDRSLMDSRRLQSYWMVHSIISSTIFLLGILMLSQEASEKMAISSGVFVWEPLVIFMTGSVTTAAGRTPSHSLIKSSLVCHVAAAVTSLAATMIYFLDASGVLRSHIPPFEGDSPNMTFYMGLSGASGIFCFLESSFSFNVALVGCREYCCSRDQRLTVTNPVYQARETPPTVETPPPPYENLQIIAASPYEDKDQKFSPSESA